MNSLNTSSQSTLDKSFKYKLEPSDIFIYLLFIPLLLVYHIATGYELADFLKSIFYFLPFYGIVALLAYNFFAFERKIIFNFSYVQLALVYILVIALGVYFNAEDIYQSTFFRDVVIVILPLFFFAFEWKFSENQFNWLFLGAVLGYLCWKKFKLYFNILDTILYTSHSESEYHFGCVAGIFFIYYLYKRKWLWLFASFVFMAFVNKRSNILGLLAAIPVFFLLVQPTQLYRKKYWLIVFLFFYYSLFWLVGTNMEFFGTLFLKLIDKPELDIDYFLTGRMILINQLQPEILDRGVLNYIFGNGAGQAEVFIWKTIRHHTIYLWEAKPFLVHNDFLKLQFEVGVLGAILYFFVLYYLYSGSKLGVLVFLYAIPLFLIDNTVIYLYNILVGCVAARVEDNLNTDEIPILSPFFRFFRYR